MTSYYLHLELFFIAVLVLHVVVQPFEVLPIISLLSRSFVPPVDQHPDCPHLVLGVPAWIHQQSHHAAMVSVSSSVHTSIVHTLHTWQLGAHVKSRLCNRQTCYMQLVNTDDNSFLDTLHN